MKPTINRFQFSVDLKNEEIFYLASHPSESLTQIAPNHSSENINNKFNVMAVLTMFLGDIFSSISVLEGGRGVPHLRRIFINMFSHLP